MPLKLHYRGETRVLGLFVGEDFVILACVVYSFSLSALPACDRQTDNPVVAKTGLGIASYADAL